MSNNTKPRPLRLRDIKGVMGDKLQIVSRKHVIEEREKTIVAFCKTLLDSHAFAAMCSDQTIRVVLDGESYRGVAPDIVVTVGYSLDKDKDWMCLNLLPMLANNNCVWYYVP
jgi:hypothetical protein